MANQYDRSECARAYSEALAEGLLYLDEPVVVGWRAGRSGVGVTARFEIYGVPERLDPIDTTKAYIALQMEHGSTLPSVSLIWDEERILGIDMGGQAHSNSRGRRIATPHRHFYRDDGRSECEPFEWEDLLTSRDDCRGLLAHFLVWSGLQYRRIEYFSPPVVQQPILPSYGPRYPSVRRV